MTPERAGHLKALEICHYVWGGLSCLFGLIPIIHIVIGAMMMSGTFPGDAQDHDMPARFVGQFLFWGGIGVVVLAQTMGILNIVSGRCIAKRRRRVFSLVIAGINCLSIPLGTVLGVFTFVLLGDSGVKDDYVR